MIPASVIDNLTTRSYKQNLISAVFCSNFVIHLIVTIRINNNENGEITIGREKNEKLLFIFKSGFAVRFVVGTVIYSCLMPQTERKVLKLCRCVAGMIVITKL